MDKLNADSLAQDWEPVVVDPCNKKATISRRVTKAQRPNPAGQQDARRTPAWFFSVRPPNPAGQQSCRMAGSVRPPALPLGRTFIGYTHFDARQFSPGPATRMPVRGPGQPSPWNRFPPRQSGMRTERDGDRHTACASRSLFRLPPLCVSASRREADAFLSLYCSDSVRTPGS